MRYLSIALVVFTILFIYKIVQEIIRTGWYDIASALGQATSSTFWSLLPIFILYFLMTRKKTYPTFRDKYPIKFMIASIFIIIFMQYLSYLGWKGSAESTIYKQEKVTNTLDELMKECNSGNAKKCSDLGKKYKYGHGILSNELLSQKFYKKACDGDDANGCFHSAEFSKNDSEAQTLYRKAEKLYLKNCKSEDAEGCAVLWVMYKYGNGVKKDSNKAQEFKNKAIKIYSQSCDTGNAEKCAFLADLYAGEDTKQSKQKAVELYKKACDGNYFNGCFWLGFSYEFGEGITQDTIKSSMFYKKTCDAKDHQGCYRLGLLYTNGNGVKKDISKATNYFKQACEYGSTRGCLIYKKIDLQNIK